jgi:hypothetical protein
MRYREASLLLLWPAWLPWLHRAVDSSGDKRSVELIVALIGLLGVLVTAAVTFIGIVWKRAFDRHSLGVQKAAQEWSQVQARHTQALQQQAEERLRMETAIRAVGLLSTPSGQEAPRGQRAGVLLALAQLGQLEFALALLDQMLPTSQVDPASAIWLVDEAFRSNSVELQDEAAEILHRNVERLLDEDGSFLWPRTIATTWQPDLTEYARETILEVVIRVLLLRPSKDWSQEHLTAIGSILHLIVIKDRTPRIIKGAMLALKLLLKILVNRGDEGFLAPSGFVSFAELSQKIQRMLQDSEAQERAGATSVSAQVSGLVQELEEWARGEPPLLQAPIV